MLFMVIDSLFADMFTLGTALLSTFCEYMFLGLWITVVLGDVPFDDSISVS